MADKTRVTFFSNDPELPDQEKIFLNIEEAAQWVAKWNYHPNYDRAVMERMQLCSECGDSHVTEYFEMKRQDK